MAGEATIRLTRSVQFGAGTVGGVTETVLADYTQYFQQTFGIVSNTLITVAIDISAALVIAISADKDCTLETNNATTPTDTFALKANQPLIYRSTDASSNFLTADVTVFYITTSESTTLKIGVGGDVSA